MENFLQQIPILNNMPFKLAKINNFISTLNLKITKAAVLETESSEYGACQFEIDKHNIIFRVGNTTPTKIGQFVTIWKRPSPSAEIVPFDFEDNFKFIMIFVYDDIHSGIFLFNKNILVKKGVISLHSKEGKRAIRVYPPWCHPTAKQAINSQKWQCEYYISLDQLTNKEIDLFKNLFNS